MDGSQSAPIKFEFKKFIFITTEILRLNKIILSVQLCILFSPRKLLLEEFGTFQNILEHYSVHSKIILEPYRTLKSILTFRLPIKSPLDRYLLWTTISPNSILAVLNRNLIHEWRMEDYLLYMSCISMPHYHFKFVLFVLNYFILCAKTKQQHISKLKQHVPAI